MYRFRIFSLVITCVCASTTSELYIIGQREGGLANINVVSIVYVHLQHCGVHLQEFH